MYANRITFAGIEEHRITRGEVTFSCHRDQSGHIATEEVYSTLRGGRYRTLEELLAFARNDAANQSPEMTFFEVLRAFESSVGPFDEAALAGCGSWRVVQAAEHWVFVVRATAEHGAVVGHVLPLGGLLVLPAASRDVETWARNCDAAQKLFEVLKTELSCRVCLGDPTMKAHPEIDPDELDAVRMDHPMTRISLFGDELVG